MLAAGAVLTGWFVGLSIAGIVVTIVVVLVAVILGLARRISVQARAISGALNQGRVNTLALWDVDKVNEGIRLTIGHAQQARSSLESRG